MGRSLGRSSSSRGQVGKTGERATSHRPERTPFSPPHAALPLPGFTLFLRAERERAVGRESRGELSWSRALHAQLRCWHRRLRARQAPQKETRKGAGSQASAAVWARLRAQADFPVHEACAPWHALSARQGPGACLPRGRPRRWPISAGTGGPSTRAHPSPAEHSWIPDKGARAGEGKRRPVCSLPAGSVPATLGFSKSLAQCAEPRQARLAGPDHFAGILPSLAPVRSPSSHPEGGFGGL